MRMMKKIFFINVHALSALDRDMDVYVTNLGNKGQNLVHTQKQLVTLLYITIDLRRGQ